MDIKLRPTVQRDVDYVCSAEQDDANARFIAPWPEAKHRAALADPDLKHFIVEAKDNHERVGFVILAGIAGANRSIEFMRIVITEKGKGYGGAAVREVKHYSFVCLAAHRLWLDVKESNTRAQTIYAREGFRYEGILRECLIDTNGFQSLIVMSILDREYLEGEEPPEGRSAR
jgi:diamine N-acetyltransferase